MVWLRGWALSYVVHTQTVSWQKSSAWRSDGLDHTAWLCPAQATVRLLPSPHLQGSQAWRRDLSWTGKKPPLISGEEEGILDSSPVRIQFHSVKNPFSHALPSCFIRKLIFFYLSTYIKGFIFFFLFCLCCFFLCAFFLYSLCTSEGKNQTM